MFHTIMIFQVCHPYKDLNCFGSKSVYKEVKFMCVLKQLIYFDGVEGIQPSHFWTLTCAFIQFFCVITFFIAQTRNKTSV